MYSCCTCPGIIMGTSSGGCSPWGSTSSSASSTQPTPSASLYAPLSLCLQHQPSASRARAKRAWLSQMRRPSTLPRAHTLVCTRLHICLCACMPLGFPVPCPARLTSFMNACWLMTHTCVLAYGSSQHMSLRLLLSSQHMSLRLLLSLAVLFFLVYATDCSAPLRAGVVMCPPAPRANKRVLLPAGHD